jgi:UTP--glucose-1-phosphate uridylyltransferase
MLRVLDREVVDVTESVFDRRFQPFRTKMQRAGLPEMVIHVFNHYYNQLAEGATGFISADEALPVVDLPDFAQLNSQYEESGQTALNRTVVIKLNGGLGTGMGMNGPKSLLPAKDSLTFLDIITHQVLQLRKQTQTRLPLVLMDSFSTHDDTQAALARHRDFVQDVPTSFLQHKTPKICKSDLSPAVWPADPAKEWCPPGHGDLYAALSTSGMLNKLLAAGYEYAFISNSDNLGATLDINILGYFAQERLSFLMEVAHRTRADSKGGHLARRPDGQLILREIAQCPSNELEIFQDIARYRYFNTNNLWLHLPTLWRVLNERKGILGLPLIRNEKPVDPTNLKSYRTFQLETAMGSAVAVFAGAQAMCVPRSRFIPIKKNNDLLVLWSDVYRLAEDYHLELSPVLAQPPQVHLDDRYYQMINDLLERFPHGAPSLVGCQELKVEGDVRFGKAVVVRGKVKLTNASDSPIYVADGSVLGDSEEITIPPTFRE